MLAVRQNLGEDYTSSLISSDLDAHVRTCQDKRVGLGAVLEAV
jgi:hypothetical protein